MTCEPELSEDAARRRRSLRPGWTTGTCASAAAKAATIGLVTGTVPGEVEVALPAGRRVSFPVEAPAGRMTPIAVVVKDAGDDPDCTDGARLTAKVAHASGGSTELAAGRGIGTVTKPGLGLEVGEPAINPIPRRMILRAVGEVTDLPLLITFSVPGGEEMALETTNERLGILGGISILGTTGIVRPFSTAAYRASVVQQIDVAAAQGEMHLVLATGHRSEVLARRELPALDPVCFVEVGDFTGIALRRAASHRMRQVNLVAMAGKLTKLAAGVMMTHFHRSDVDTALLEEIATQAGASAKLVEAATSTATARHFAEVALAGGERVALGLVCERARQACQAHVNNRVPVSVWMSDFEGTEVVAWSGEAPSGRTIGGTGERGGDEP
ncbi:MAG: cobalt-precorrin-5B (C(1))-methyltransferase [Actinomycetota bacterium]|nr:cobalt-precorrin-5B (C(1))-methyltransferase [Actinomycetota bacterium]